MKPFWQRNVIEAWYFSLTMNFYFNYECKETQIQPSICILSCSRLPLSIFNTQTASKKEDPETNLNGGHSPNVHSRSLSDPWPKTQKHTLNWFHILYLYAHSRTHTRLPANSTWPCLSIPLPPLVSFICPLREVVAISLRGFEVVVFFLFFSLLLKFIHVEDARWMSPFIFYRSAEAWRLVTTPLPRFTGLREQSHFLISHSSGNNVTSFPK